MVTANGIQTNSSSSDIFQIFLEDEDGQNILSIDDGALRQSLLIRIVNTSGKEIKSKSIQGNPSVTNYHFCISFRAGTLFSSKDEDKQIKLKEESDGWHITQNQDDFYLLKNTTDLSIKNGESITLTLQNIGALPAGGSRGTRVEVKYNNLKYQNSNETISGNRLLYLNIVNQRGKKQVPLYVGFLGSNTVLNDDTENELILTIQTLPRLDIPLEFKQYNKDDFSRIELNFNQLTDRQQEIGEKIISWIKNSYSNSIEIQNDSIERNYQALKSQIATENNEVIKRLINDLKNKFLKEYGGYLIVAQDDLQIILTFLNYLNLEIPDEILQESKIIVSNQRKLQLLGSKDQATKFTFSFDIVGDDLNNSMDYYKNWDLTTVSKAKIISILPEGSVFNQQLTQSKQAENFSSEYWDIRKNVSGTSPQWTATCQKELTLGSFQEILRLSISNLKTNLLSGYANLYVHYENIPGYWDGFITVPIHKGPLVYRQPTEDKEKNHHHIDFVGIGVVKPQAMLHVKPPESHKNDLALKVEGNTAIAGKLAITNSSEHLRLIRKSTETTETTAESQLFLELFQETSNPPDRYPNVYPNIRFHQGGKFWKRIEVRPNGFHFQDGELTSGEYVPIFAGQVGIGISEVKPQAMLHVKSPESHQDDLALKVEGNTAIAGKLAIGGSSDFTKEPLVIRATQRQESLIAFEDPSGKKKWHIEQNYNGNTPGLNFVETDVADFRLFLKSGGNVGIGTGSPQEKLHIQDGSLRIDNGQIKSWGAIVLTPDIDNTGDKYVVIKGKLAVEGEIWSKNYGNYWQKIRNQSDERNRYLWEGNQGNGDFTSDIQLKKETSPIPNALSQIEQLKPVSFYWQDIDYFLKQFDEDHPDPSILTEEELEIFHQKRESLKAMLEKQQFGFIAQDLEQVFPDWVSVGEEGYKQINLRMLPPFLVQAIRELSQQYQELAIENQALLRRLEVLENQD